MPRMRGLTVEQKVEYQRERIPEICSTQMYKKSIRKKDIANLLGITPQAVSSQLSNKKITTDVLMAIVTLADMEPTDVKDMLTVR